MDSSVCSGPASPPYFTPFYRAWTGSTHHPTFLLHETDLLFASPHLYPRPPQSNFFTPTSSVVMEAYPFRCFGVGTEKEGDPFPGRGRTGVGSCRTVSLVKGWSCLSLQSRGLCFQSPFHREKGSPKNEPLICQGRPKGETEIREGTKGDGMGKGKDFHLIFRKDKIGLSVT